MLPSSNDDACCRQPASAAACRAGPRHRGRSQAHAATLSRSPLRAAARGHVYAPTRPLACMTGGPVAGLGRWWLDPAANRALDATGRALRIKRGSAASASWLGCEPHSGTSCTGVRDRLTTTSRVSIRLPGKGKHRLPAALHCILCVVARERATPTHTCRMGDHLLGLVPTSHRATAVWSGLSAGRPDNGEDPLGPVAARTCRCRLRAATLPFGR